MKQYNQELCIPLIQECFEYEENQYRDLILLREVESLGHDEILKKFINLPDEIEIFLNKIIKNNGDVTNLGWLNNLHYW